LRKSIPIATTIVAQEKEKDKIMTTNAKGLYFSSSDLLDRKIEFVTADLRCQNELSNGLHSISTENALIISDYIIAMKTENNPSDNCRSNNIRILYR
jgi:hypothetical protein